MHRLSKITSLLFSAAFILMASTFAMAAPADDFNTPTGAEIQKEVSNINAAIKAQGGKWVAGETSMSVLSPAERKMRLGAAFPSPGETLPGATTGTLAAPKPGPTLPSFSAALPSVLDWRNYTAGTSALAVKPGNYVTPVRNQASCGDCWVFGSVAGLESRTLITQNTPGVKLNLSEESVVTCDTGDQAVYGNACAGGFPVTNFFSGSGIPFETCAPYIEQHSRYYAIGHCSNTCTSYFDLLDNYRVSGFTWIANFWGPHFGVSQTRPSVDALKNALYQYGPVVVSYEVFSDFYHYKRGIYSFTGGYDEGGHIVLLVGYDDINQCFIVKNSWGPGWGEHGFFRIAYSQVGGIDPYWTGSNWYFYGPYFGGYALAYTGAQPPTLNSSITYPAPGSCLSKKILRKAVCTITGMANTALQKFLKKVELSYDGGTKWRPARDTSANRTWTTWSYNWPLPKDGTYTIFPMATDSYTNSQGAGVTVMVDNTPPSSAITAPAAGPLSGTSYLITGTASDNLSGVNMVEVSTDGGKTWNTATITSGSGTTSATWSYNWAMSAGAYTIKSRATDTAENVEKPAAAAAVVVHVTP